MVQAMSNRAAVLIEADMLKDAAGLIEQAENIAKEHKLPVYNMQNNLGLLYIRQKKYSLAREVLIEARRNIPPDNFTEFATVNFTLGRLMNETGGFERAVYFFETALKADRLSGFHKGIADDLAAIGSVYYSEKKYDKAVDYFKRSIKIYALIEKRDKVSETANLLEKAAEKANLNISVTQHFVKNWLEGKAFENPCK
jgi:tetratricopeptide (TPR) repeat protein